ncbi:MAG: hypothetical protein LBR42_04535 [Candidatus Methanoplasma sp.]|jgi:ABC-type Fe3+-hydroxamate transport system substrate-binding protein|nr:hypothetical protein [Candidatus Methanoplasma sp.]
MNVKILALSIVAIVCVGAVAAYFVAFDDNEEGPIEIVDGSGKTITLSEPLSDVVVVNTNIPKQMKILGLEDEVVGIAYASQATSDRSGALTALFPNLYDNNNIPFTKNITGESMVMITKCVICPVKSMSLSETQEKDLANLGVIVIRLDCNGDTALDDLKKLTILFGETKPIMDAYDGYYDLYYSVVDTVKEKVKLAPSTADNTFLYYMVSSKWIYNQTSDGNTMIETVYGKNVLRNINNIPLTGVTNDATDTGIGEVIRDEDVKNPISKIFLRAQSTSPTVTTAENEWNTSVFGTSVLYEGLSAIDTGEVYMFNSNIMSGCLSYVGYVLLAEVCGIETGYDAADIIEEYNETYGFEESTSGLVFQISGGKATMLF